VSVENFEAFRALVLTSDALQARLRAETDPHRFVVLVVDIGAANGLDFSEGDVRSAMAASRRRWLERRRLP
jgi:hypothetical protein